MTDPAAGAAAAAAAAAAADSLRRPHSARQASSASLEAVLAYNRAWATRQAASDPAYFKELAACQTPEWLWIGCSDSRVPANQLLGLDMGRIFVQRNVGNLATHKDLNAQACLEYAVGALGVAHVVVVGHHNCGAVKAALELPAADPGLVNLWIQDIRAVRDAHAKALRALADPQARWDRLVELNVVRQVFNVCTSPAVQRAWAAGQPVAVHGLVYSLRDGLLRPLTQPLTCLDDFEHYSADPGVVGEMDALSKDVLAHLSFEREALGKRKATEDARR